MQKLIASHHDKHTDTLKLDSTRPSLANICLHKSTDAKFYTSTDEEKQLQEKNENSLLVVHLSFLHTKQLVLELLSESLQTYANLSLGLMKAKYTPTRCINSCPLASRRVGIWIRKPVDLQFERRRPVALKKWSWLTFNEKNLFVKSRASALQADKRKLTASVLMGFVLIVMLCLRQWIAFTTFGPVKRCVHLLAKKLSNVTVRLKELVEMSRGYIHEKGLTTVIGMWKRE